MKITKELGMKAIYGGLLLGGGGGGSIKDGVYALTQALKYSEYVNVIELSDLEENDLIVTASMVGSPSSKEKYVDINNWKFALDLMEKNLDKKISGFITNENGGMATTNGWIVSALAGIPIIDAPCNGRAHPTGTMGSMGLTNVEDYISIQALSGGKGERNISLLTYGNISNTSRMARQAAVEAGGFVCVLRNPVTKAYAEKNSAIGAIKQAIEVGHIIEKNLGYADRILNELSKVYKAKVICTGFIKNYSIEATGGFDIGELTVEENNIDFEITFWNEYMTAESNGERLSTFPDLIATLDAETGIPKTSAEIAEGDKVILISIPKDKLILGSGMYDIKLFKDVEDIMKKDIIKYHF